MTDLREQFCIGQVASDELAHLLLERFTLAQQDGDDVVYSRGQDRWAIRLSYRGGELVGAEAGPGLSTDDANSISRGVREDLLAPQHEVIGRAILVSALPNNGSFRVGAFLQLLPAPPNAPRPPYIMADHPLVVEFPHRISSVSWITSFRFQRALTETSLFLNSVTFGGARIPGTVEKHWMFVPGAEPAAFHSEFLQEGYFVPDFVVRAESFSNSAELIRIRQVPDTQRKLTPRGYSVS